VFMLIEHMRNDPVRDFITAELRVALEAHSNIPVGILVDPVGPARYCSPRHPTVSIQPWPRAWLMLLAT